VRTSLLMRHASGSQAEQRACAAGNTAMRTVAGWPRCPAHVDTRHRRGHHQARPDRPCSAAATRHLAVSEIVNAARARTAVLGWPRW
jgi:hypothetical protein